MKKLLTRTAKTAVVAAIVSVAAVATGSTASAVPAGGTFGYGALSCRTAESGGDGMLWCSGTQNGYWRTRVTCRYGFTYYGNWANNSAGGTRSSWADSNCWWGVQDISINVPA